MFHRRRLRTARTAFVVCLFLQLVVAAFVVYLFLWIIDFCLFYEGIVAHEINEVGRTFVIVLTPRKVEDAS